MPLNLPHTPSAGSALIDSRQTRSMLILREADPFDAAPHPVDPAPPDRPRRTRIWEFGTNLHCSIIGTCLTTAELRHVLVKLKLAGAETASDHDLHSAGVMLAGNREGGAKFLQKAMDRRHHTAIGRGAKAKDATALLAFWEEALKQGDVPGAYWAMLTHPAATDDIVKRAFADVHMLSHLVGAANRADIRRLRQMEQDNAALAAKIERQQRQLRDGFAARDQTIRRLNEMVAQQADTRVIVGSSTATPDHLDTLHSLIRDLNGRLSRETARRERNERRVAELAATLNAREAALDSACGQSAAMRRELETVERHLATFGQPEAHDLAPAIDLAGATVLYVGGRAHQVPQLKGVIERLGARFLHHDGGIEHSGSLLAGAVSRADHVLFPIDCISHDAVGTIKRLCRLAGKDYEPLRTASLACLFAALVKIGAAAPRVAAE